ncbi:MAG: SCO family protein [Nitrospirae bacterium]|nr:SCO family protein [Nitrospirota bacterium]
MNIAYGRDAGHAGGEITVDEQLGSNIPLDITFHNEKGDAVFLGELIDRPVVIAPVYLSCNHTCPLLLIGLADVIGKSNLKPGTDYKVLSISFDETDTPRLASEKKPAYLKATNIPFPEDAWSFLTGDAESINKFTGAAGFHFKKEHAGFSHPVTLIFMSRDGKIVRYLSGVTFLPFEFEMAVTEASKGRVVSLAKKALLYCMSYDSQGKRYVFNTLKVVATLIIVTLASFFIYLVVTGRNSRFRIQNSK